MTSIGSLPAAGRTRFERGCGVALVALVLGAGLFAVRPLVVLDQRAAPALLALIYATLLAVALAPELPDVAGATAATRLSKGWVSALGFAAVTLVRFTGHPVIPPDRRFVAIVLGVAAAVAEEAYFRRLMHGVLARAGALVAIVAGAALFALMHYPAYGASAMPLDFGAGLLFAWQRWASGSWAPPALTHSLANLLSSV